MAQKGSKDQRETRRALQELTSAISSLLSEMQSVSRQQQAQQAKESATPTGRQILEGRAPRRSTTSRQERTAASAARKAEGAAAAKGRFNLRFGAGQIGAQGGMAGFMGGGKVGAALWVAGMAARKIGQIATASTEPLRHRSVSAEAFASISPRLVENVLGFTEAREVDRMALQPVMQAITSADAAGQPMSLDDIKRAVPIAQQRAERLYGQYTQAADIMKGSGKQTQVVDALMDYLGGMAKDKILLGDSIGDFKEAVDKFDAAQSKGAGEPGSPANDGAGWGGVKRE